MDSVADDIDQTLSINCVSLGNLEDCSNNLSPSLNVKILSYNIRSIHKNFDAFLVSLKRLDQEFDAIALSECWLTESSLIPQIPGYCAFRTHKYINKCGGVTVYVKDTWSATVRESDCEDCNALEVMLSPDFLLVAIYRSPSFEDASNFLLSLDNLLRRSSNLKHIVVAGDINLNIISSPLLDKNISDYMCLMSEHQLLPAITEPTREDNCLDHIFVKNYSQAKGLVCHCATADHCICILGLELDTRKSNTRKRTRNKIDLEGVEKYLRQVDWTTVTECNNVVDAVAIFSNEIDTAIKNNSRIITLSRTKFNLQPWITPGLMKCQKIRDNLHMQARKNPTNIIFQKTYTRYRNFLTNLLRSVKSNYDSQQITINKGNGKKLWHTLTDICHLKKFRADPTKLILPGVDPQSSLNKCNDYFTGVGLSLAQEVLRKLDTTEEALADAVDSQLSVSHSFFMKPTNECEIDRCISDLKHDSAPGLDNCTPALIKHLNNAQIICYADDTVILFKGESWEKVHKEAEKGMAAIARWLESNLLTLNESKTQYLAFHKTKASIPTETLSLRLHTCAVSSNHASCDCLPLKRTNCVKYLGVLVDENLNFGAHISSLSKRVRKIIYVFKSIRRSADKTTCILVYKALCQSIISYCIRVWGGAAKTKLKELERAQRALLKVMLRKPRRYPTNRLYLECQVLRVRALFIHKSLIAAHSMALNSPDYERLKKRRVYRVPIPQVRTSFAQRLPSYTHPFIYNAICRIFPLLKDSPTSKVKRETEIWLRSLDYDQLENILPNACG
ncbi:reverse transcriptase (RNA-dependent DNA polymerase) domain-containing protein [Phthorimaea operculella]|nr:reverse transcriptase (RNA-dependent DNA polymerase) domain-containing protein [Phthorimaea operculella]